MANDNYLGLGQSNMDAAVANAQGALAGANVSAGRMRNDAAAMRGQAQIVNTQGQSLNITADELASLATTLTPYAAKLGGYGDDLNTMAESLTRQSNDSFGQAGFLANMDPNATGLAAEFMKMYGAMSPERYVSRAGSDAQAAAENAMAQNERALARRGVSAGSGASLALRQQYARALAELTASAKTKAWDEGNKAQGQFLNTMTGAAKTFYDMGSQSMTQALSAKTAAGNAQTGAADVVRGMGALIQDAGTIRSQAGQLFANAANIFGSAGQLEGGAEKLSQDAIASLSTALGNAAKFYLEGWNAQVGAEQKDRSLGLEERQLNANIANMERTAAQKDRSLDLEEQQLNANIQNMQLQNQLKQRSLDLEALLTNARISQMNQQTANMGRSGVRITDASPTHGAGYDPATGKTTYDRNLGR